MLPYNKSLIETAKELRKHPTKAEKCLWERLQQKHLGVVFYRQKPIGEYIVDFYCAKAHLVIEVDGGHHFKELGKINDKLRDEYLNSLGLRVLRYSNSEVLGKIEKVARNIKKILLYPPLKRGTTQ